MTALPARHDIRQTAEEFDAQVAARIAEIEASDRPEHIKKYWIDGTKQFARLWGGALTKPAQQRPERIAA